MPCVIYIPVHFLFEDLNTSHFDVCLWECFILLSLSLSSPICERCSDLMCHFFFLLLNILLKTSPGTTCDPKVVVVSRLKRGQPPYVQDNA